tara:strand:- start:2108 stop:2866 length:759 start_codon:yes stop_codon:yes gene_type:complete
MSTSRARHIANRTIASTALPKAGGTMTGNIVMSDDTSIGIADDAERIEFDGAGDISVLGANLGINTDAPLQGLHMNGKNIAISEGEEIMWIDSGGNKSGRIYTDSSDVMHFSNTSNSHDRFQIDASGNLIHGSNAAYKMGYWYVFHTSSGNSNSGITTGLSGHRCWATFTSGGNKRADVVMWNGRLNPGSWTGQGFVIGHTTPVLFSGSHTVSDANNTYYISVSGGVNQLSFGRNSGGTNWDLHLKAFINSN